MTFSLRQSPSVRFLAALAFACSATLASKSAAAFCRTTTTPLPANFDPRNGCYTGGLPIYWRGACVGYAISQDTTTSIPTAEANKAIDEAFAAWNVVTCGGGASPLGISTQNQGVIDCAKVRYDKVGTNQNIVVFRDTTWPYSDVGNTLALTTITFNEATGEIYDADMEINTTGKNISVSDTVPAHAFDLKSIVTHEAGHFLGLAHAQASTSTMYATYPPGKATIRELTDDDKSGVCAIYPDVSTRTIASSLGSTISANACDATPRHGFSDTCDGDGGTTGARPGTPSGCTFVPGSAGKLSIFAVAFVSFAGVAIRRRRRAPS
jgi:hypothetical protein